MRIRFRVNDLYGKCDLESIKEVNSHSDIYCEIVLKDFSRIDTAKLLINKKMLKKVLKGNNRLPMDKQIDICGGIIGVLSHQEVSEEPELTYPVYDWLNER